MHVSIKMQGMFEHFWPWNAQVFPIPLIKGCTYYTHSPGLQDFRRLHYFETQVGTSTVSPIWFDIIMMSGIFWGGSSSLVTGDRCGCAGGPAALPWPHRRQGHKTIQRSSSSLVVGYESQFFLEQTCFRHRGHRFTRFWFWLQQWICRISTQQKANINLDTPVSAFLCAFFFSKNWSHI